MGLDAWHRPREARTVTLHRDGEALSYHMALFERVIAPAAQLDSGAAGCVVPTSWNVYLWRDTDQSDGVMLEGGDFGRPLAPVVAMCPSLNYREPTPTLVVFPPRSDGRGDTWRSTGGHATVSTGATVGPCTFLGADAARFLRDEIGVSCEITRHRIGFNAWVRRTSRDSRGRYAVDQADRGFGVVLEPTEVLGIRYTIHCEGPQHRQVFCARPSDSMLTPPPGTRLE